MTIQECYEKLGGSYDEVVQRLFSPKLVRKFIEKFLSDKSYEELRGALQDGRHEDAFRAAHTLKGVCQNLGLTRLAGSSSALTEALRPGQAQSVEDCGALFGAVERDYGETVDAIRAFLAAEEQA